MFPPTVVVETLVIRAVYSVLPALDVFGLIVEHGIAEVDVDGQVDW